MRDDAGDALEPRGRVLIGGGQDVRWGTRLDQVPAMIQAGLKQAELEATCRERASMYSQEQWSTLRDEVNAAYSRGHMVLADLDLSERRLRQARDVIEQGIAALDRRPV